jgi:hypothetical protein
VFCFLKLSKFREIFGFKFALLVINLVPRSAEDGQNIHEDVHDVDVEIQRREDVFFR